MNDERRVRKRDGVVLLRPLETAERTIAMKATVLLEKQHRRVETLLKKLEKASTNFGPILLELANELAGHMTIEQDIFYPAIREVDEKKIFENFDEHAIVEIALKRLLSSEPDDPSFKAKVHTLRELVCNHVREEEASLFPRVEAAVDANELDALGRRMKSAFEEAVEYGYAAALRKGRQTSADAAEKQLLAAEPRLRVE